MSLVMETVPWLRSFSTCRGCGTSDEIQPERAPRTGALFVWPAAAVIQSPFAGRYEPDSAFLTPAPKPIFLKSGRLAG
jgi:hypothetical protein